MKVSTLALFSMLAIGCESAKEGIGVTLESEEFSSGEQLESKFPLPAPFRWDGLGITLEHSCKWYEFQEGHITNRFVLIRKGIDRAVVDNRKDFISWSREGGYMVEGNNGQFALAELASRIDKEIPSHKTIRYRLTNSFEKNGIEESRLILFVFPNGDVLVTWT